MLLLKYLSDQLLKYFKSICMLQDSQLKHFHLEWSLDLSTFSNQSIKKNGKNGLIQRR